MVNPSRKKDTRIDEPVSPADTDDTVALPNLLRVLRSKPQETADEALLFRQYNEAQNPKLKEKIRNDLIARNIPLVVSIAERLKLKLPRYVELDDLVSNGTFGLIDAIDGFEIDRGIKFSTYASTRVRGSMIDALRAEDWVPRLERIKASQFDKLDNALFMEFGIHLVDRPQILTHFSLSEKWEDSDDESLEKIDVLEDKSSDSNPTAEIDFRDMLEYLSRGLDKREISLVVHHLMTGVQLRIIGEFHGITESRACQIEAALLIRLRELFPHLIETKERRENRARNHKPKTQISPPSDDEIIKISLDEAPTEADRRDAPIPRSKSSQPSTRAELKKDLDDDTSIPLDQFNLKLTD